jgi:hypothetical protein
MKLLNKEKLEKLNTKRLLFYKDSLMQDIRISQNKLRMEKIYSLVKEILSTREHID